MAAQLASPPIAYDREGYKSLTRSIQAGFDHRAAGAGRSLRSVCSYVPIFSDSNLPPHRDATSQHLHECDPFLGSFCSIRALPWRGGAGAYFLTILFIFAVTVLDIYGFLMFHSAHKHTHTYTLSTLSLSLSAVSVGPSIRRSIRQEQFTGASGAITHFLEKSSGECCSTDLHSGLCC